MDVIILIRYGFKNQFAPIDDLAMLQDARFDRQTIQGNVIEFLKF